MTKNLTLERMRQHKWSVLLAVVFLLLLIFPPAVCTKIKVNFEDAGYQAGERLKILTSRREDVIPFSGLRTTYAGKGECSVYFLDPMYRQGVYLRRLDPIDTDAEPVVRIRSIELYCNGIYGGTLEGEELYQAFTPNDQVQASLNEAGSLELWISGADSQLFPTETFRQLYAGIAVRYSRVGILYLILLAAVTAAVGRIIGRLRKSRKEERYLDFADAVLWLTALGVIVFMALAVFRGDHTKNPDEWESRDAVRYYTEHNVPPDIRDAEVEPTIGTYGTTRLTERNPYYFYAGKLAALFPVEHKERLFGLCLGAGLLIFALLQARKNRYLLAACFLTPQLWYLYAYCTSDALDYFVSVIVLYQLANSESMLNRLVRRGVEKADAGRILLLGLMFAHIMMAKANYFVILIYAFFMLLVPLLQAEGEERKQRSRAYLWILLASLLILGIRLGVDVAHYGLRKSQIVRQIQEQYAVHELNPAAPAAEQAWYYKMYRKGISFWDYMTKYGLHKSLLRSSMGVYGGLKVYAADWYYKVMTLLYFLFNLLTGVYVWKKIPGQSTVSVRLRWIILYGSMVISYLLVLGNGYLDDFQPQGRYILPVFVLFAHAVSLDKRIVKSKWFNFVICAAAVLALYSFAIGTPQLWEV